MQEKKKKDFQLWARVVVRTSNFNISRRRLADVKIWHQKACSMIIFPHSTNLVHGAFLRQGEGGREKTLASADHVIFKHPEKLGVIIEHFFRGEEF